MPEITNKTMCIAIQALAKEIRKLEEIVAAEDSQPEEQQILEDYERAAKDLEQAYNKAAETALNLPPYDMLIGVGPG
jgi:hypothetical protein